MVAALTLMVYLAGLCPPDRLPVAVNGSHGAATFTCNLEVQPTAAEREGERQGRTKWWQRFNVAVGPGVRIERLTTDLAASELTFTPVLINRRVAGGGRSWFGWLGGGSRDGLAPTFTLNLRARRTEIVNTLESDGISFGDLNLRPIMAGVRWRRTVRPKWTAEIFGMTGYSFNDFNPADGDEEPGRGPRAVLPRAVATIDNSWAWQVGGKVWFDVLPRLSLMTGASFLGTRPRYTLTDGSAYVWDGDRLSVDIGIAVVLFKGR
jgi:hypothetical protein